MAEAESFENGRIAGLQVVSALGSGGFGSVWLAHDPRIDRQVAVKVLHAGQAADPELRMRFIQEARFLDRAGIDLVVGVHALDELPDGRPYIVMEYAQGGSLEDRLHQRLEADGAPAAELATVIAGLGRCLDALHRVGLVHRDIKPANVLIRRRDGAEPPPGRLLSDREQLVLADFGVARTSGPEAHSAASIMVHSYGWSAPEQLLSVQAPDHRADVFAATMIVLWAATGRLPVWTGQGPVPVDLPTNVGARGPAFEAELRRGLAFAPEDRHPSAAEWSRALLAALATDRGQAPTAVARPEADPPADPITPPVRPTAPGPPLPTRGPVPSTPVPVPDAPPPREGAPSPGRRRLVLGVGGLVAVGLIGGGVATVLDLTGGTVAVIGPEQIAVGDETVFVAPEGEVTWTVAGQARRAATATVTPTASGTLTIEADDGERSRSWTVTVVEAPRHPIVGPALVAPGDAATYSVPSAPADAAITWSDGSQSVESPTLTLRPTSTGVVVLEARFPGAGDQDSGAEVVTVRPVTVGP